MTDDTIALELSERELINVLAEHQALEQSVRAVVDQVSKERVSAVLEEKVHALDRNARYFKNSLSFLISTYSLLHYHKQQLDKRE